MTTAEMKYRACVPYGWVAIKFCDIRFYNDPNNEYSLKWGDIEFDKAYKHKKFIKELEEEINKLEDKKNSLYQEYKSYKKWYRPWLVEEQKEIKKHINVINLDIQHFNEDIQMLEKDKYYEVRQLIRKGHDFLEQNGFRLKSHTINGEQCTTDIEIWEKE